MASLNTLAFAPTPMPLKSTRSPSLTSRFSLSVPPTFPSLSTSRPCNSRACCFPIVASKELSYDFSCSLNPSLAHANTLFFKSAYNVQVVVGEDEPEEVLLRRFRREVFRAGIIQECKRRRFFETKQEEKKRKLRESAKRNSRRRRPPPRRPPSDDKQVSKKSKDEEEEDNWDLPEGELPY